MGFLNDIVIIFESLLYLFACNFWKGLLLIIKSWEEIYFKIVLYILLASLPAYFAVSICYNFYNTIEMQSFYIFLLSIYSAIVIYILFVIFMTKKHFLDLFDIQETKKKVKLLYNRQIIV